MATHRDDPRDRYESELDRLAKVTGDGPAPDTDGPGTLRGDMIDAPASKPPQINLRPLSIGSDGWRVDRADTEAYGDIRDYHRDGLRRLATLAEMSHGKLHDRADRLLAGDGTDDDRALAGLTLLWATGSRFTTAGGGLQPATPA